MMVGLKPLLFMCLGLSSAVALAGPPVGAASKVLPQCSGDPKKDDPEQCSHAKLLEQGSNVYKIYSIYHQNRLNKVAGKTPSDLAAFQSQGICQSNESWDACMQRQGICRKGDTWDNCVARNKRLTADAELQARQELVRQGRGRMELTPGKDAKSIDELFGDPSAKAAAQGHDNVLKDLANGVQRSNQGGNPVYSLLAAPQPVQFGPEEGDALRNTKAVDASQIVDLTTIDPALADKKSDPATERVEAATGPSASDQALTAKLQQAQKNAAAALAQDKKSQVRAPALVSSPNQPVTNQNNLDMQVYTELLNEVAEKEGEKDGKKGLDLTQMPDNKDEVIVTPVHDPKVDPAYNPQKSKTQPLDSSLESLLGDSQLGQH